MNFLKDDYHLNLDEAFEEIRFLYLTYGLEDDNNLTKDAIKLKNEILQFINNIIKLLKTQ